MNYKKEEHNTVKRGAKKARYDKETVHAVLDATEICNVAFSIDGKAFVQPINFGRKDEKIYIHGSHLNRMTNALLDSGEVCLSVMILDAMKLTRSAFHHSVNYRSAVVFGKVKELISNEDKIIALESIINHFVSNRWEHCRKPNLKELKATKVIEITIETASAKIADRPNTENKEDYETNHWGGVIPINISYGTPVPDTRMDENLELPAHLKEFIDKKNN